MCDESELNCYLDEIEPTLIDIQNHIQELIKRYEELKQLGFKNPREDLYV